MTASPAVPQLSVENISVGYGGPIVVRDVTMEVEHREFVTILGPSGSGKTTLLNHILTAQHGKKIAVIENEFGEVGIDDALLAKNTKMQASEEIIEMMNGCICCTVRQDLVVVLDKLAARVQSGSLKLDGIVIETTGMADPAPIVKTFAENKFIQEKMRYDGTVTVVDCKNCWARLDAETEDDKAAPQHSRGCCCKKSWCVGGGAVAGICAQGSRPPPGLALD